MKKWFSSYFSKSGSYPGKFEPKFADLMIRKFWFRSLIKDLDARKLQIMRMKNEKLFWRATINIFVFKLNRNNTCKANYADY